MSHFMFAVVVMLAFSANPSLFSQDDVQIYSCATEAVWTNCPDGRGARVADGKQVTLHLLAHVSRPGRQSVSMLDTDLDGALSISVRSAVFPASGAVATAECTLEIERR